MTFEGRRRSLLLALCIAPFASFGALGIAHAQTELVYASNLDPANTKDPRTAAQAKIIAAFEAANPDIKVTVLVDPTQASYLRALKSKSASPDVIKVIGFGLPEYVATGGLQPLDQMAADAGIDEADWLLPLNDSKVDDKLYGLPLDYRIPLFLYRKSALEAAGVEPPTTWDEVCELSKKLSTDGKIGYSVGIGSSGGLGGAQAFSELMYSSMVTEGSGDYFGPKGDTYMVSEENFVRAATTIKNLFANCAVPAATLQFGYNETHDGLRAGTVASATFGLYRFAGISNGGAADDLGWAPGPGYAADGKQVVYGYYAALNANSANKEAAWKLVQFLGSPEAQAMALEGGEVVARKSAYATSPYLETDAGERQIQWSQLVTERGFLPDYPLSVTAYNAALGDALQRMVLRDGTPQEAYQEVKQKYEQAMAQSSP